MRWKCKNDRDVLEWWDKRTDRERSAIFIQQYLEHNGRVFLMANTTPQPRIIFRVKKSLIPKLQTEEMESPYLNVRLLKILARRAKVAAKKTAPNTVSQ